MVSLREARAEDATRRGFPTIHPGYPGLYFLSLSLCIPMGIIESTAQLTCRVYEIVRVWWRNEGYDSKLFQWKKLLEVLRNSERVANIVKWSFNFGSELAQPIASKSKVNQLTTSRCLRHPCSHAPFLPSAIRLVCSSGLQAPCPQNPGPQKP